MLFFADGMSDEIVGPLFLAALAVLLVPNLIVSGLWNLHFKAGTAAVIVSALLGGFAAFAAVFLTWETGVPPFVSAVLAVCAVPPMVLPKLKGPSETPTEPSASPCDTAPESSSATGRRA